jgi:hypothetical protein
MKSQVKTVGPSGQISLGKQHAGEHVLITEVESGFWQIKTADVIPHNERFWHQPHVAERMDQALERARRTPARANTEEEIEALFAKALAHAEAREKTSIKKSKK